MSTRNDHSDDFLLDVPLIKGVLTYSAKCYPRVFIIITGNTIIIVTIIITTSNCKSSGSYSGIIIPSLQCSSSCWRRIPSAGVSLLWWQQTRRFIITHFSMYKQVWKVWAVWWKVLTGRPQLCACASGWPTDRHLHAAGPPSHESLRCHWSHTWRGQGRQKHQTLSETKNCHGKGFL